jgi:hypothetical protein
VVAYPDNVPVIVPLFKITPDTLDAWEADVNNVCPIPTPPVTINAPVVDDVEAVEENILSSPAALKLVIVLDDEFCNSNKFAV